MATPTDNLVRYRPWRGELRGPVHGSIAMARMALRMMLRRKLFWALYALAALIFFFFFYGQYLVVWIQIRTANQTVNVGAMQFRASEMTKFLDSLSLNGTGATYANFIWFQGYVGMILLSLAGAVLVGNDFHHGSLAFYLAKPIGRRHYLLGKFLGAAIIINLLTTIPAIILFVQAGLLYDWQSYYIDHWRELLGIFGYGAVLTITLGLLLVATAIWLRRTVPLIMVWAGLFVLCRMLAGFLVDGQRYDPLFRLIDLWNDMYLVGGWCLGVTFDDRSIGAQPQPWQAAIAIAGVCAACALYLRRRVQAVEIVS